jgi:hypothetical protein
MLMLWPTREKLCRCLNWFRVAFLCYSYGWLTMPIIEIAAIFYGDEAVVFTLNSLVCSILFVLSTSWYS